MDLEGVGLPWLVTGCLLPRLKLTDVTAEVRSGRVRQCDCVWSRRLRVKGRDYAAMRDWKPQMRMTQDITRHVIRMQYSRCLSALRSAEQGGNSRGATATVPQPRQSHKGSTLYKQLERHEACPVPSNCWPPAYCCKNGLAISIIPSHGHTSVTAVPLHTISPSWRFSSVNL